MMEAVVEIDEEKERREILKRYRAILKEVKTKLQGNDAKQIKKAFQVAAEAHKDMRRKSGEPYIYHPLEVAQICVKEMGMPPYAAVCALLHDVVEDTDITLEDIERDFGKKVARTIDGLTKTSGSFEFGSSQQAENFRKMLLTLSEDTTVILVKLADRLHNMRTLDSMARDKQLKISSETIFIYAPLAHRLGLHLVKTELENLYLKYAEPDDYIEIEKKLDSTKRSRERFVAEFTEPIARSLTEGGYKFSIKARTKSAYSIWNKMRKQKKQFEDIYDLFAVRIIMDSEPKDEKSECWHAYSLVTDNYQPNPERLKDWVSTPRANGYESLHITVMYAPEEGEKAQWVEVQIRSKRMDEVAEKGVAAHYNYKGSQTKISDGVEQWINQVRDSVDSSGKISSAIDFMDEFRANLYSEEVFAFTPKGDLRVLRRGATALDFAFDIHSQVGAHCMAAKVNGTLVPIRYVLNNGDQVEIITSKKQKPHEDWLDFVKTSKARANIKDLLKEENKQYFTDGRNLLEKKAKVLRLELTNEVINQLRAYFNCKTPQDLYYRFGKAYINPDELKKFKAEKDAKEAKQQTTPNKIETDNLQDGKLLTKALRKAHGERADADVLLIGEDMDRIDYTLSPCCNPIAGDDVFGFVTVNDGIKVHRTSCPNAPELLSKYGHRIIKSKWASQLQDEFLTQILIKGTDRVGIVNDVTRIISTELSINIRSLNIISKENVFEGQIGVLVNNTAHLDELIMKLNRISGIMEVMRFDEN